MTELYLKLIVSSNYLTVLDLIAFVAMKIASQKSTYNSGFKKQHLEQ